MVSEDDPEKRLRASLREEELVPGTVVGDFRVEGKLGQGGQGSVYAAIHPLLGKRAAIKVLSRRLCADLHAVERFIQEARAVHHIGHPNIVDSFAFGTLPDGRAYFMMEWLQGDTLAAALARGQLKKRVAYEILIQMCDALEAAHEKGVIHRDLKPDNVFLVETRDRPLVKILDFGLAKLADSDVTQPRSRSRSGVALGTAGYMSPEQARGKPVDGRTDVYALGAMAFQMLLGRLPFDGESAIDILAKHLAEPVPAPRALWPQIPRPLEKLLVQLLDKEVAPRPQLSQVRTLLVELRDHAPREAGEPRSKAWMWAIPVALIAGVSATVLLRPHRAEPPPRPMVAPVAPAAVALPPAAKVKATLRVQTNVPAEVKLDDRAVDITSAIQLEAGTHHLQATAAKRKPYDETFDVAAGAALERKIVLRAQKSKTTQAGDYTLDPFQE
jgi:serine/threonine-protein kinase